MRYGSIAIAMGLVLSSCGGDDDATMTDGGGGGTDARTGTDGGGPMTDSSTPPPSDAGGDDGTLSNAPAVCEMEGLTFAAEANTGHYAAARLTPSRYPFTVTSVFYTLPHSPGEGMCDADQAHEVLVFTGAAPTPVDMPAGQTIAVPAPATPTPTGTNRLVELTLTTPVVVNSGESLFVAVKMTRATDPLCLEECLDPGVEDRNWWSAAAAPPFPWRTLASYDNDGTLTIGAIGD